MRLSHTVRMRAPGTIARVTAKPRASRRRIAEMSYVLRALLDDLAAAGGLKGIAHREALDLVDAFVRGEATTPETIAG